MRLVLFNRTFEIWFVQTRIFGYRVPPIRKALRNRILREEGNARLSIEAYGASRGTERVVHANRILNGRTGSLRALAFHFRPSDRRRYPVLASADCDRIVGTWRWFNGAKVECLGNGRCEATNGFSGPWKCLDPAGRVEIRWGRGGSGAHYVDTVDIAADGSMLSGTNQLGGGVSASWVAPASAPVAPPVQRGPVASEAGYGREDSRPAQKALSRDQQGTVELLGWPHAFNVLQIEDQQRPARYEAWTWFDSGLTYIFVDGEFRFVEPASGLVPEVQPTRLRPHRFVLGLSPAGVRSLSAGTRWESLPLLVDLPGVSLFLTDDFAASFHNGALVGIETQLPPGLLEEGQ